MNSTKKIVFAAMFIAVGLILPFFTGQIPQIGAALLPMHIPALFCGMICGWQYGLICGLLTPVLRSAIFTMPPMFPMAICMAFELGTYGLVSGWLYNQVKTRNIWTVLKALVIAMLAGRLVYGLAMFVCMGTMGSVYSLEAFISGTFLSGIPGIVLQLILIPAVMSAIQKTKTGSALVRESESV